MDFQVHANGSGKRIRVNDRVGGGEVFNQFLDAGAYGNVTVGSADGLTGDIDVTAQMLGDSPVVNVQTDYAVKAGEVLEVYDV